MPDNPLLQLSNDGSHTLISEKYQVTYHSIHGAVTESNVVFIDAGLNYLKEGKHSTLSVFEMGFGTGLNALLAFIWAEKNQIKLIYHTVEAYPVDRVLTDQLNYSEILGHHGVFQLLHSCEWNKQISLSPYFSFCKYHTKVENLDSDFKSDVIFFDAFSPASQPQLWEPPLLAKMYHMLNDFGVLVSYCAQGAFKRNLKTVGFRVEGIPGPPGKREMTRAIK
jgi:tRNA U34 5-methylaminomethyl-2-thiouridine-forming methyltransferase MnmC